ncbi:MAG: YiiX/YebB-like N1pC/P60 family cysteine hydrolase [Kofleriaceae bacterium]
MVHWPEDPAIDAAITSRWAAEIRRTARDGDWILTRSYYLVADGIAAVTGGTPLSHASIYSAERGTVIEAVGSGVREISLEELLGRNHYAIVVRPAGMSAEAQAVAVEVARGRIGAAFDTAGMFGLGSDEDFYCSELVWWASDGDARYGVERVITPSELMEHGEVVYWSGERDDAGMVRVAAGDLADQTAARHSARVAAR